jgi:hypothetical protein
VALGGIGEILYYAEAGSVFEKVVAYACIIVKEAVLYTFN